MVPVPKKLHLDKRAASIAATAPKNDDLLSTPECAAWLGVSEAWLENARVGGFGPPFRKMSARVLKYKRSDVLKWLDKRTYTKTSQYMRGRKSKRGAAA